MFKFRFNIINNQYHDFRFLNFLQSTGSLLYITPVSKSIVNLAYDHSESSSICHTNLVHECPWRGVSLLLLRESEEFIITFVVASEKVVFSNQMIFCAIHRWRNPHNHEWLANKLTFFSKLYHSAHHPVNGLLLWWCLILGRVALLASGVYAAFMRVASSRM